MKKAIYTWSDVIPKDFDGFIAIHSIVLVKESQRMKQLVQYDVFMEATIS